MYTEYTKQSKVSSILHISNNTRILQWCGYTWLLRSGLLFHGSINRGHYTSLVNRDGKAKLRHFNDDFVTDYEPQDAIEKIRANDIGLSYGLVYERID